jgi:hypothetical protein
MFMHFYWTTSNYIPGDAVLDTHRWANLRSNLYVNDLLKDAVNRSDYLANDKTINECEGLWKETIVNQFEGNISPASWRDWGKPKNQVKIANLQVRFNVMYV